jgi:hypothetical protein
LRTVSVIILVFLFFSTKAQKQFDLFKRASFDSTYYDNLDNTLTLKVYSASSNSKYKLTDQKIDENLQYKINSTRSLGVGFGYRGLGMNMGYAFPFMNTDDTVYGDTKLFDFSTQLHYRKSTFSIYINTSKGLYLQNSKNALHNWPPDNYYIRPDVRELRIGLGGNYLLNYDRYSNRAAFLQNEWQKKSSGSFVLGGTVLYHQIKADSSIIPTNIRYNDFFRGYDFNRTNYFYLTGEFGYTFTLVLLKHLYFNGMLMTGIGLGSSKVFIGNNNVIKAYGINLDVITNLGLGYNSKLFFAGLYYSSVNANTPTAIQSCNLGSGLGKFRLVLAYRIQVEPEFTLKPKWLPWPKWLPADF